MKTILLFLALASAALGQTTTTNPNLLITNGISDTHLFRQATAEEQMRGEANRLKEILKHADPEPTTILWGQDYIKKYPALIGKDQDVASSKYWFVMLNGQGKAPSYEFGLRSDGVVVWREVKP